MAIVVWRRQKSTRPFGNWLASIMSPTQLQLQPPETPLQSCQRFMNPRQSPTTSCIEAQVILQRVQAEMNARHPKATPHVMAAMSEINTALKTR